MIEPTMGRLGSHSPFVAQAFGPANGRTAALKGCATVAVLGLLTASCGGSPGAATSRVQAASLSGNISVDGSSTVVPVSRRMAEAFQQTNPAVHVTVGSSSTSDGFNKLCAGQVDIADASRPINAAEEQACRAKNIDFIELPIAFDSLSVVVNPKNTFVSCLTVAELKKMWEPAAEGKVKQWKDIRASFPAEPIALFAPGSTSGTFDYFTLAINGTQGHSRGDYTKSDDDTVLANAVAADPNGLAYFGYAYYRENRETLKLVSIDNGKGCVAPSAETVMDATYEPLSRPIFLYVNATAAARPEVAAFAQFAISPDHAETVQNVGYVPLPPVTLLNATKHLEMGVKGSIFGGRGAVLGVTADMFADDDKIKNALVR
jgi:phosphate transport system substrate-binding protein